MKKQESKSYKIIWNNHSLNGHILSTAGCCQSVKNEVYGHVGWTPVSIDKKYLKLL